MHNKKHWVAGARGLVGSAIVRRLQKDNAVIIPDPVRAALDLRRQSDVENWMAQNKPDVIYLAAARVGGVLYNAMHPADFIADNLQIETNIITTAAKLNVGKLVFLGSSCIYPREAPQPLREEYLLTGPLEETNRAYAIAKLAGLELVRSYKLQGGHDFISVLPCNLYGPNDTYDAAKSHVIPALMLKVREAIKTNAPHITLWGTGTPLREFLHVDDAADAIVHLSRHYSDLSPVNIGTGQEITIKNLAKLICEVANYKGDIVFDASKPDGTPRKVLDITRAQASSWTAQISLQQGLVQVWQDLLE
jgi:GDP-L-fucose synthase